MVVVYNGGIYNWHYHRESFKQNFVTQLTFHYIYGINNTNAFSEYYTPLPRHHLAPTPPCPDTPLPRQQTAYVLFEERIYKHLKIVDQ